MNPSPRSGIGLLIGLTFCLVGLALSLHALRVTPPLLKQIRAKQQRLQRLADLRQEQGQAQDGFAAFAARERTMPSAVSVVIENVLPDAKPEIAEFEPQPAAHGTRLLKVNVNLGVVDLAKVNPLLHKLETYDPPWRILECKITAAAGQRGRGRVTLALEALEKL